MIIFIFLLDEDGASYIVSGDTQLSSLIVCHPQERNVHNKVMHVCVFYIYNNAIIYMYQYILNI